MILHRVRTVDAFSPISLRTQFVVGAVVAGITFELSRGALTGWLPPLWVETNELSRESLIVLGPIVAGLGAWVGGWRHTLAIGQIPARGWDNIAGSQLWLLIRSVITGHLIGLTPVVVYTNSTATAGRPEPLVIVSGLIGIAAVLTLGYALGVMWPSRLAIPISVVAVYPLLVGPVLLTGHFPSNATTGDRGLSFYSVALVWLDYGANIGTQETFLSGAVRTAFLSAVLGATFFAAIYLGETNRPHRFATAALPFIIPAACAGVLLVKQPILIEHTTATACHAVDGETSVCVPSEVSVLLPDVVDGAQPVIEIFGYGALTNLIEEDSVISNHVSYWYFGNNADAIQLDAGLTTARYLSGDGACAQISFYGPEGVATDETGSDSLSWEFARLLTYSIAERAGFDATEVSPIPDLPDAQRQALDKVEALTDAQLRLYLDTHHNQLASCTARPASLDL